ncbi:hypothetical protein ACAF76_005075 [Brevibacillus sp. TJ4]|uniref:hypothetical protein n=1 Tax=Brevibacillus sp. TJ4 TaxID=3234853 RepID=UPI0037D38479
MSDFANKDLPTFFSEQIRRAKVNFERALDCKHTDFDDLYPYMNEQPQFFWYKRYVAWSELLTVVRLAGELGIDWKNEFSEQQIAFIEGKVLQGKVLDYWNPEVEQETTYSQVEEEK